MYYYGTVARVTSYRCFVEFDNGDNEWIKRYGPEAECIRLTTAPPNYNPPQVEPVDLEPYSFNVVYSK